MQDEFLKDLEAFWSRRDFVPDEPDPKIAGPPQPPSKIKASGRAPAQTVKTPSTVWPWQSGQMCYTRA